MTTEDYIQLHNQTIAKIERNLSALVEAQQKSEQEIAALAQFVVNLRRTLDRIWANVRPIWEGGGFDSPPA